MKNKEVVEINLYNKIVRLYFKELDTDVDTDEWTQIHYENLYGEMVSISTLMNQIGIMKAEIEYAVNEAKLSLDMKKAELEEYYRKKFSSIDGKKTTIAEIEGAVFLDKAYQDKRKRLYSIMKELGYIDSLYWAIQSKDKKLSVLMKGITPEEFEDRIVEGVINGMMIKKHEKLIKNTKK